MKNLVLLLFALFIVTGCSLNTQNLTFKEDNKLRVTYTCEVPFDDVRLVRSFEEMNTTKDVYYVEFNNIYESYFEHTQTYVKDAHFSLSDYIEFLEEDGATIHYENIANSILYITFQKRDRIFNQIVSSSWHNINIATVEPMMFKAIEKHCTK